jgi:GNAT superfamily N-acetyltransferase
VINSRAEVRQFRWFRAAVTLGAGVLIAWLFYGFLGDYYFPFKNKYLQGDSPLLILAGLWPVSILGGLLGGALGELITKVLLKAKPTEKGPAETEGIKNKKHWEPILRILRQGFLLGGFFGAPIYGFMVWGWAIRIIPQVGPIPAEFLQALTSESVLAPFLFAPMNLMFSKLVIGWRWARFREVVQEARASLLSFFFLQFAIWVPGYTWGLQPSDTIERMARINAVGIFYQALLNVASHLKTIGFFSEFSRRLGFLYRVIKSPIGWLQGYYNKPWFGMFILTVGYGFYVTFIARVILWAGASRFLISAVVLGFGLFWFYAFVRSRNLLVPLPVGQGHEGDEGKGEKRDSFPGGKQAGSGDRRAEVRSSRFEIAPPLLKRLIQQYFGNVRRIAKRRRVSYQTVANWIREHHLVLFAREWRKKRPTKAELLYPGYERLRSALVRFRALRSMVAAAFTGASETLVDQWVEKRKGLRKLARRLQKEREETVGLYPGDARFERSLIRNHGLQQRVAKDFGVTQPTVLKWEREHRFRTLTKELRASRSQKTNHRAETRSRTFQTLPTGRPPSAETKRLLRRIRTNSGRRGPRPSPRSEARTEVRVVSAEELSRDPGAVAEAIYEIDRQTFSKAFRLTPAGILSILRDKRNRVFIAVEGDQEVGFSIHRFEDENSENAHLDRMAVLPRFRNQGIGSLILDTVIADVDRERGRELAFFPFRLSIGSDLPLTWYRSYVRKRASQGFELSPFQVPNSLGWKIRWNSKYSWATWELIRFFTGERGVRIRSELRAPIQGVEKSRLVQRGLNRLAGFLPPAKNIAEEFGLKVPEAEAAVADILIRHEGMAASEVRARSWLSRLGLPSSETVRERDEKIAFIYLEGAAFETGLLAAVPSLLEAYGENARAGVVTPDALHPVVQKIEAKLRAGQEIIEGEDLGQVIEQISAFKPGRMVVFTGPDDPYFPTGFLKQLLPDSGIEVEVKPVSQADLEWAKGSLPDLFDEIESLQREVRLIRQAA